MKCTFSSFGYCELRTGWIGKKKVLSSVNFFSLECFSGECEKKRKTCKFAQILLNKIVRKIKLNGEKFFSRLDLLAAYLRAKVDKSCKYSLTQNTSSLQF